LKVEEGGLGTVPEALIVRKMVLVRASRRLIHSEGKAGRVISSVNTTWSRPNAQVVIREHLSPCRKIRHLHRMELEKHVINEGKKQDTGSGTLQRV
jgi:hypothetical protein